MIDRIQNIQNLNERALSALMQLAQDALQACQNLLGTFEELTDPTAGRKPLNAELHQTQAAALSVLDGAAQTRVLEDDEDGDQCVVDGDSEALRIARATADSYDSRYFLPEPDLAMQFSYNLSIIDTVVRNAFANDLGIIRNSNAQHMDGTGSVFLSFFKEMRANAKRHGTPGGTIEMVMVFSQAQT